MHLLDVELYTSDRVATRFFYAHSLGLPLLTDTPDRLTFQVGWTRLTFRVVAHSPAPLHLAFNVPVGAVASCPALLPVRFLDTHAPGYSIAEFPGWQARARYFFDPNGNLLECIERRGADAATQGTGPENLFQCVSEVGIATEDVGFTTSQLARRFDLAPFIRSIPQPDFCAVGDDNGLFILSQVGRPWLFTDVPTAPAYVRVGFLSDWRGTRHEVGSYELHALPVGWAGEVGFSRN